MTEDSKHIEREPIRMLTYTDACRLMGFTDEDIESGLPAFVIRHRLYGPLIVKPHRRL